MTAERTIEMLQAGYDARDCVEWRRKAARLGWVKEIMAALKDAQTAMDRRCAEAAERLSEQEFTRLFDEEQAKVDAIRARIDAVIEHGQWPKHLYFGGV